MQSLTVRSIPIVRFVIVSLLLAAHHTNAQADPDKARAEIRIGSTPIKTILKKLGARMEHGIEARERDAYARHFGRLDRDGDGRHSKVEYIDNGNYMTPQARRGIFMAADGDKDGFVTRAEYILNRIITDEAKAIVQGMDDDKDGAVQRSEFVAHTKERLADEALARNVFEALDTNEDGAILIPEYLRVWGQWARAGQKSPEQRLAATTK